MTAAIVEAVKEYNALNSSAEEQPIHAGEASLTEPAVGQPISHSQILDIYTVLRSSRCDSDDTAQVLYSLDNLLRGSQIYIPPPKPKAEPVRSVLHCCLKTPSSSPLQTQEFQQLMARLRREEEARKYNAMLTSSTGGTSSNPFALPTQSSTHNAFAPADDEEEMTFSDINRQIALIINVLISIIACGVSIWLVASHISAPKRLALAMGGALLVAVAEVVIYAGYLRRLKEAKVKEKGKKETKTVVGTWTIGRSLTEKASSSTASSKRENEASSVRHRAGKRR